MRISDWSSDVCSSDLAVRHTAESAVDRIDAADTADAGVGDPARSANGLIAKRSIDPVELPRQNRPPQLSAQSLGPRRRRGLPAGDDLRVHRDQPAPGARKSLVWGKSGSVRVDLGGGRRLKKKTNT